MAASAYAALVSLSNFLEQVESYTLRRSPPMFLDKKQTQPLRENITSFLDFLERNSLWILKPYSNRYVSISELETKMAVSAHEAEEIIERYIVRGITNRSTSQSDQILSFPGLERVLGHMESVKRMVGLGENALTRKIPEHLTIPNLGVSGIGKTNLDKELRKITVALTKGNRELQTIPILGVSGTGKTTLAKRVYGDPSIMQLFDIHAWVSVSQEFSLMQLLSEALTETDEYPFLIKTRHVNKNQLPESLYKRLLGRRYLIVLDGVSERNDWDKIRPYLPDNKNISRIIVTTRFSSVATYVGTCPPREMKLLPDGESWYLIREQVFGYKHCPRKLEKVGRKIAQNCLGFPLSVVVLGGFLAQSKITKDYWERIERDTRTHPRDNKFRILSLCYNYLPVHLKPCFLYMGVFPEDKEIRVTWLINLWIGKGFLKQNKFKYLEAIGEEYLNNLISRNLIYVHKRGSNGKIKSCRIHSLVRDLCLAEAQKETFMYAMMHGRNFVQDISSRRRISIQRSSIEESLLRGLNATESGSADHSLISDLDGVLPLQNFRLLKVLKEADKYTYVGNQRKNKYSVDDVPLIDSRYIAFRPVGNSSFPSSLSLLWNLQILIVEEVRAVAPSEIWEMAELRYLEFRGGLYLPDPVTQKMEMKADAALTNLQTLTCVENLRCGNEVLKRIPNVKKLGISYVDVTGDLGEFSLQNLGLLEKLESLSLGIYQPSPETKKRTSLPLALDFPHTLKKLTLFGCEFSDKYIRMIGLLPNLEVLKLKAVSFRGHVWVAVEPEFNRLKFLLVEDCDLMYWLAYYPFPRLEHLVLRSIHELREIPWAIVRASPLQSIELDCCSKSLVISAMVILEEQRENGNDRLEVRVRSREGDDLDIFASNIFPVQDTQASDKSAFPSEIQMAESEMSILGLGTNENLSPTKQQELEVYNSDQPEGSGTPGNSIQIRAPVDTLHSVQDACNESSTTLDESIVIPISGIGNLDLKLKIFHASLQEMQHLVIGQVKAVLPPERLIYKGVSCPTELPTAEEWHQSCVVCLKDMAHSVLLPEKPDCPNLAILFLHTEIHSFHIPPAFFDLMPALRFLNLSGIKSTTLPSSLFSRTQLQVLLLRNCFYLDSLSTEIKALHRLEVLDLSGTELCNLPDHVGQLSCLRHLQLSLYGPDDENEYTQLPSELISVNTLSKLHAMQALSISVHPDDYRWRKIAGVITKEIAVMKNLTHLQFYFPEIQYLQDFMVESFSWTNKLETFKFVVGRDVKRIAPRIPDEVESKFHQPGTCLRFVNGDGDVPKVVKEVLERATSFCLDHHLQVHSLSQLGISNLRKLKFCLVTECSSVKAIIDGEEKDEAVLPNVEFMGLHYLWNLQCIWSQVHMPADSFNALKRLNVYTCRELKFVFLVSMHSYFSSLEELTVEDCDAMTKITEGEMRKVKDTGSVFPQLKKVELRYLPRQGNCGFHYVAVAFEAGTALDLIPNQVKIFPRRPKLNYTLQKVTISPSSIHVLILLGSLVEDNFSLLYLNLTSLDHFTKMRNLAGDVMKGTVVFWTLETVRDFIETILSEAASLQKGKDKYWAHMAPPPPTPVLARPGALQAGVCPWILYEARTD